MIWLILAGFIILGILIFICGNAVYALCKEYFYVNKNKSYIELFEYFCKISYDQIYKDQIVAFSSSGYRVSEENLETSSRNFVKLTINAKEQDVAEYLKTKEFFG